MKIIYYIISKSEKITKGGYEMIIRFEVENFLSFNKKQSFSMIPGRPQKKKDHVFINNGVKLLKLSAIYGGNASGKSNLVKSIDLLRFIILNKLPTNLGSYYFREEGENKNKPTKFEVEFIKGNSIYAYGIEIICSQNKIVSEWLYELLPGEDNEIPIYERELVGDSYIFSENPELIQGADKTRLDFITNDIDKNYTTLLLTEMNRNKKIEKDSALYFFKEIFEWFSTDLRIYFPNEPITRFDYVFKGDNNQNKEINKLISLFDTGINKVMMEKTSLDEHESRLPKELIDDLINKYREEVKKSDDKTLHSIQIRSDEDFYQITNVNNDNYDLETIKLCHGNESVKYDFRDESDGTRRLFDLIDILLTKENNKIFIVDEIDRSLHPNLTYRFIELFYEIAMEKNIQLIFTTHESKIMDLELVRQDEIWFVEKNRFYESELYSLDAFKERYDRRVEKAYLEGRYGAIPVFGSFETFADKVSED